MLVRRLYRCQWCSAWNRKQYESSLTLTIVGWTWSTESNKSMVLPLADEGTVVHQVLRTEIGDYNVQGEKTGIKKNAKKCRENNRFIQMIMIAWLLCLIMPRQMNRFDIGESNDPIHFPWITGRIIFLLINLIIIWSFISFNLFSNKKNF